MSQFTIKVKQSLTAGIIIACALICTGLFADAQAMCSAASGITVASKLAWATNQSYQDPYKLHSPQEVTGTRYSYRVVCSAQTAATRYRLTIEASRAIDPARDQREAATLLYCPGSAVTLTGDTLADDISSEGYDLFGEAAARDAQGQLTVQNTATGSTCIVSKPDQLSPAPPESSATPRPYFIRLVPSPKPSGS